MRAAPENHVEKCMRFFEMCPWTKVSPAESNCLVLPKQHPDIEEVTVRYEGRVERLHENCKTKRMELRPKASVH